MVRFLENPNIPAGKVRTVLLGSRYADLLAAPLTDLCITPLLVDSGGGLDPRVSAHPDMLAHHLGGSHWIAAETGENALKTLKNVTIYPLDVTFSAAYPGDIPLNLLRLGDAVYGRLENASPLLLEHLSNRGVEQVRVRQGYAKCSVCIVSRRAAITADSGLASAMERRGVDVLRIPPENITLDGFDAGFIGGATGLIAPDKLAFTGRLDCLNSADAIRAFLQKHNVTPVELTDRRPFDVGSILPVTEEVSSGWSDSELV